ncbi:Protein of unknown function (DUF3037) [Motilibacter peucedani]|uniref:DUF3037 family protein n=1 Tax=Motilibacter peucedani TaxID=598650 RepID=A0A420XRT7_9ACTN|nr:DUF3037 domain-containing protein [Motilibacter peucedani]RKS77598.1 Protein of unknown function (DUF3037) [Motilibacter peucedani]
MSRFSYSLVRCVPDPRTGEFVNVGAIAGSAEAGEWAVRQVSSEARVRKLAGPRELEAVHGFLARVGEQVDIQMELDAGDVNESLPASWLEDLHHDHRNVVQLSPPAVVAASSAESALDLIFERMLIDPVSQPRDFVDKKKVVSGLRAAYKRASIADDLVKTRVDLFVGDHLRAPLDFAIANGVALQLTQAWSFQRASVDQVTTEVKAWGYALARLREGAAARVVGVGGHVSSLAPEVDLEVVVALPKTKDQEAAYEEATQVFNQLDASVRPLDEVDFVSAKAAELVAAHH